MIKEPPSGGSFALPSVDLRQRPDLRRQPGRGRAGLAADIRRLTEVYGRC